MKTIFLIPFFFIAINLQAGIWYVNKGATGSNTGRSWANAWTCLDSAGYSGDNGINWNVVQPGDTIYIGGGTDSLIYYNTDQQFPAYGLTIGLFRSLNKSFASGNPVVIARAWQSGHNGKVYITATSDAQYILWVQKTSNIKFVGINILDQRTDGGSSVIILGSGNGDTYDSLVTFENCHIIGNGNCGLVYFNGYKYTVKNCTIEQLANNLVNDQDPISMSGGQGCHTVDGCTIIMRNGNESTDAHRDGIQISNVGTAGTPRNQIRISNNLIIDTNPLGVSWNNMIYNYNGLGEGDNNIRLLIYNNIIVTRKIHTACGGIATGRYDDTYSISLILLNNTFIFKGIGGSTSTPIVNWNLDTLIMKNNIIITDTTVDKMLALDSESWFNAMYKSIDYNYYAEYGGISGSTNFAVLVSTYSWNSWRSTFSQDSHSNVGANTSVTFTSKYSTSKSNYYTTTGRDAGTNLSSDFPFLSTDILGNARTGTWDLGALEYGGEPGNNVDVKAKVFLQGPFSTNVMLTSLNQDAWLPTFQPYNSAPWNYNGTESFNPGQNPAVVDWVLVELRNASNPSQVFARRAALLKNNGLLLETNGIEGINFNNISPGSYYLAIFHRNHLAIMSASPVQFSSNSTRYDFTTAMNKAYGQNPMVQLAAGKFGMYASDGNSDGIVNTSDRDNVWLIQNGNMGYLGGDFNMNSGVTVHDVNQLWNLNNGRTSQVP